MGAETNWVLTFAGPVGVWEETVAAAVDDDAAVDVGDVVAVDAVAVDDPPRWTVP